MTTAHMLEKIRDALAADAEFIGYCVAELGSAPTIQLDFDEGQELEADNYPFVGIISVQHSADIRQQRHSFTLMMLAATRRADLNSTTQSVETSGGSVQVKTRTYTGRLEAETLREQAIACLYRSQLGKVTINSEEMSHTYHPKFYSPFSVTIEAVL